MAGMKAIVAGEPGEPGVLRYVDVERPAPRAWEVLIEVEAAGVNYADTMRRRDRYLVRQKFPFTSEPGVKGNQHRRTPCARDASRLPRQGARHPPAHPRVPMAGAKRPVLPGSPISVP